MLFVKVVNKFLRKFINLQYLLYCYVKNEIKCVFKYLFQLYFFHIPQSTNMDSLTNTTTPLNFKIHTTPLPLKQLAKEINSPTTKKPQNEQEKKKNDGNNLKDAVKVPEAQNKIITPQKSSISNPNAKSAPPVKRSSSNNG